MFFAGLHPGEARGARWEDYSGKTLTINQSVRRKHTTDPKTASASKPVLVIEPLRESRAVARHRRQSIQRVILDLRGMAYLSLDTGQAQPRSSRDQTLKLLGTGGSPDRCRERASQKRSDVSRAERRRLTSFKSPSPLNPPPLIARLDCSPVPCRSSAERKVLITRDLRSQPVLHSIAALV